MKTRKAAGFTLVEIAVVVGIIALLAAFSIPNLIRNRLNVAEMVAIGSCQTLAKACQSFYTRAMPHSYPDSLATLAAGDPAYIDPVLGSGQKQGYQFVYTFQDAEHFQIAAQPVTPGRSGNRYFFLDESGVIRVNQMGPAGPADIPVEG